MLKRDRGKDLAVLFIFALLALIFFFPVTVGGKTMLPADAVFAWEPWKSFAAQEGIQVPHNSLVLDLYIENYAWKHFIRQSLQAGQLPLWNPYILGGVPFLAAGQHSAMYPFSVLFYVLPLSSAYGWFAALHLFLAGAFTYLLARTLGTSRGGGLVSGVAFMFGGFMVIRNVFPMIVAAAVWLPLILAMVERIVRRAEEGGRGVLAYIPDLVLGALGLGMVLLAGHAEMDYYVAIATALFSLWRLAGLGLRTRRWGQTGVVALALLAMGAVGLGLGAAQWLPLLELVQHNFREGAVTFQEVLGWAYPPRRVISLLIPDFFGNPTHHSYFDLFSWERLNVTMNALGQPIDTIYWDIKNYVEGASYAGIMALLLACIALLRRRGRHIWFFAGLAIISLLFVFGSRLYWVIFQLPGLNQVHSPFRWIYLYSLSVAIMAGMGVDAIFHEPAPRGWQRTLDLLATRWVPLLATLGGALLLLALAASLLVKEQMAVLAERVMAELALAPQAFADGRMFYSYQFRNLLLFGLALLVAGAVLLLRQKLGAKWAFLAALALFGELYAIGHSFFPAIDPALVAYRTPAVDFLCSDQEPYRITAYVGDGEKTFDANSGMLFDIQDARGYDSIIPRRYVEYMRLIAEQGDLQYNRIAPIYDSEPEALDSPLLDLLNVKYVLASRQRPINRPGYELVYDGELLIYRNVDVLPRAFMVGSAQVIADKSAREEALKELDPRKQVILEEQPSGLIPLDEQGAPGTVTAITHAPNEVLVTLSAPSPGFLVLSDSFFDGWLAFIRPADSKHPSEEEQALHIYCADGNFRAVEVPAGEWQVRFKYSPNTVKFGLFGSFVSAMILLVALALWALGRRHMANGGYAGQDMPEVSRVTRNTLMPILFSLLNRVIDMVFAMLWLRVLGPADAGQYAFAVALIAWFEILTNFGLNTFVTREVARDQTKANGLLCNATALRLALSMLSLGVLGGFIALRNLTTPLDPRTVRALWLFAVALVPSNISAGLSAVFMGYERMQVPAFVTTITTLLKVVLGGLVLLLGAGYVGLAAVSIVVNVATLGILGYLVRRMLFRPRVELDLAFQREMLRQSYPLMINNLLATLFFKVAILLLEWQVRDSRVLGWYNTSYKYIDAVGIIPAYFTMAIFPLMSRYATDSKESLVRAYRLAVKLLVMVAIPLAFIGWFLADGLIGILGGSQYLPQGADILRVMIWYMPVGFINSVTQYVLIALNRQRYLTRAFAIGLVFSLGANLIFIRMYGYMASAYVTMLAELVLFIPFYVGIRRYLAPIAMGGLLWRHAASALPLTVLAILAPPSLRPLALLVGLVAYAFGLFALGALDRDERRLLAQGLPIGGLRTAFARLAPSFVDRGGEGS